MAKFLVVNRNGSLEVEEGVAEELTGSYQRTAEAIAVIRVDVDMESDEVDFVVIKQRRGFKLTTG